MDHGRGKRPFQESGQNSRRVSRRSGPSGEGTSRSNQNTPNFNIGQYHIARHSAQQPWLNSERRGQYAQRRSLDAQRARDENITAALHQLQGSLELLSYPLRLLWTSLILGDRVNAQPSPIFHYRSLFTGVLLGLGIRHSTQRMNVLFSIIVRGRRGRGGRGGRGHLPPNATQEEILIAEMIQELGGDDPQQAGVTLPRPVQELVMRMALTAELSRIGRCMPAPPANAMPNPQSGVYHRQSLFIGVLLGLSLVGTPNNDWNISYRMNANGVVSDLTY